MKTWLNRVLRALRHGALRVLRHEAVVLGVAAALLAGAGVLAAVALRGEQHESRLSLLAGPTPGQGGTGQYGEVVALGVPALAELARSPSVLGTAAAASGTRPEELAEHVGVELVPASGLARLSVRAPSAEQAARAVSALAAAVMSIDLLAPEGELRLLDDTPDTHQVAPDHALAVGLALAAAALSGVSTAAVLHLRRTRSGDAVRAALTSAGVRRPVAVVRDEDPAVTERLTVLCEAAARPTRVLAVVPELAERAEELAQRLPDKTGEPGEGGAVIAVVHGAAPRQDELAAVAGALRPDTSIVAVVLA
ncbi:hypothetical protein [Saccharothrix coeruleofusca]|uniref:Capsular polysaccharide biosynthesis protein n=1 Tax=Saccharothrix coeruleofusca TaxID=33919 RepID=A0A918ASJ0_9PSEU|nr:hypothetical protein [Saccharothrix coeruleofusca]MBP2335412.1 hypothetical protein [Saccharothrix coeruleofusca]GGP77663.1 hypothetical protein GCM10010185_59280 [Saccharothrix coeruleofusca]